MNMHSPPPTHTTLCGFLRKRPKSSQGVLQVATEALQSTPQLSVHISTPLRRQPGEFQTSKTNKNASFSQLLQCQPDGLKEQCWEPLGCQREPKINQMEPKLFQDEPKGSQVEDSRAPESQPQDPHAFIFSLFGPLWALLSLLRIKRWLYDTPMHFKLQQNLRNNNPPEAAWGTHALLLPKLQLTKNPGVRLGGQTVLLS